MRGDEEVALGWAGRPKEQEAELRLQVTASDGMRRGSLGRRTMNPINGDFLGIRFLGRSGGRSFAGRRCRLYPLQDNFASRSIQLRQENHLDLVTRGRKPPLHVLTQVS